MLWRPGLWRFVKYQPTWPEVGFYCRGIGCANVPAAARGGRSAIIATFLVRTTGAGLAAAATISRSPAVWRPPHGAHRAPRPRSLCSTYSDDSDTQAISPPRGAVAQTRGASFAAQLRPPPRTTERVRENYDRCLLATDVGRGRCIAPSVFFLCVRTKDGKGARRDRAHHHVRLRCA